MQGCTTAPSPQIHTQNLYKPPWWIKPLSILHAGGKIVVMEVAICTNTSLQFVNRVCWFYEPHEYQTSQTHRKPDNVISYYSPSPEQEVLHTNQVTTECARLFSHLGADRIQVRHKTGLWHVCTPSAQSHTVAEMHECRCTTLAAP